VDEHHVIAFLDWLTADGTHVEFTALMSQDNKKDYYWSGERVTLNDIVRWVQEWLEQTTGHIPSHTQILKLAKSALKKVASEGTYPKASQPREGIG
jgi:hypothetical protein